MQFAHPQYLWFLLLLLPCVAWYLLKHRNRYATISISTSKAFTKTKLPFRLYLIHFLFGVRMLAMAALVVIIARPQSSVKWSNVNTEGTDIVIALDISSSMLAEDFVPDRLEAAKKVATKFINGRENDNIGLVVFAGECFTPVPMTLDHALLINYLKDVEVGMLIDNTAIGDGLATAINRIKEGKAKSQSIILLTDGSHNAGQLHPLDAADIAAEYGIKVYTIGVGKNGYAPFHHVDEFGRVSRMQLPVVIDEETLTSIADKTGGKYFRATNDDVLADIFNEIDKLETTVISEKKYAQTDENYLPWAVFAILLIFFELVCRNVVIRNIP